MHVSLCSKPSDAAALFVQLYLQREVDARGTQFVHPVPARAAHMLSFQFGDPVGVRFYGTDIVRTGETAALVGPQTHHRCQLVLRGHVETFVIVFQPSAIYRLFRLPADETVDRDEEARAVLGAALSELRERLGNAITFADRVQIADRFIIQRSSQACSANPIDLVATEILLHSGGCRIDALVADTGLNIRTFQRSFQRRIGVSPKLYSRIVRFESALRAKAAAPDLSWTSVAQQFGYHDQMHLIHDFRQLSGETPTDLLANAEPVFKAQMDSPARPDTGFLAL